MPQVGSGANRARSRLAVEPVQSEYLVRLFDDPEDSVRIQQMDVDWALGIWILEVHEFHVARLPYLRPEAMHEQHAANVLVPRSVWADSEEAVLLANQSTVIERIPAEYQGFV